MAEFRAVAYGPELHRLLLRVAGHAPADALAGARLALAEGRAGDVALTLGTVMAAAGLPPNDEEFALLGALEPDSVEPLSDTQPGQWPPLPLDFRPLAGDDQDAPPLLDLTGVHADYVASLTDTHDQAATAAAERLPGARALWRAWRLGAEPAAVFVLEAGVPAEQLPVLTATLQRELQAAGLPHPLVETYAPGDDLPPYQRQAREASALLWTAEPPRPVAVARVFDGADPDTGPWFDRDHPLLGGEGRDQVLAYLDGGWPVLTTTERADDILDPERGPVVPLSYRSDGVWVWTDTVAYYLREHHLAPDLELLAHMDAADYRMPAPDAVAVHRVLAALLAPAPAPADA